MQIYDITVAPNRVQEVASSGRYLYYYNGSAGGADASITVKHDMSGTAIVLKPGQAFRLDEKERGGGRWLIGNYANAAPILGRVVVGNGRIDDNTITGSVEVIDGGKNRTMAGTAYIGTGYQAAVAAMYSGVQLWNPAGSGKNLMVGGISAACTVSAWTAWLIREGAKLASNVATFGAKKDGSQTGVGVVAVGTIGAVAANAVFSLSGAQQQANSYKFTEPMVVRPGEGITLWVVNAVNLTNQSSFEWFEEAA
ncbi:hypothetical protein [Comamonas sp.]|uniref:hypothetical protein n=1 Tax=Comamonas sp. TaxID=34028 RepID=UPI003A8D1694